MNDEDVVTRFLFWLEAKVINWRKRILEASPDVMATRDELAVRYARIAEHKAYLMELYPEEYAALEEERRQRFAFVNRLYPDRAEPPR